MTEHRLMERMIQLMKVEYQRIQQYNRINVIFVDTVINFIKMYADKCHHKKEEDILFIGLRKRAIPLEQKKTLNELVEEHNYTKNITNNLFIAQKRYLHGDKNYIPDIAEFIKALIDFYPKHIEREDKYFSLPSMSCICEEEKDVILNRLWPLDSNLINEKYRTVVEQCESCYR